MQHMWLIGCCFDCLRPGRNDCVFGKQMNVTGTYTNIEAARKAMDKTGHTFVYSLSPVRLLCSRTPYLCTAHSNRRGGMVLLRLGLSGGYQRPWNG